MGIEVQHSERDIVTAIVLIKAMVERGAVGTPVLAALSPEHGWRVAAVKYLDLVAERRQRGLPLRVTPSLSRDEGDWQELNERLDWEEHRESAS